MNAPNRPLRNERLEVVNRQDSQALFDPVTGSLHTLDPTSMAIWEACDGETTTEEMVEAVAILGDLSDEAAGRLVAASLRELRSAGLLSSG